jgi:hypothetical protein
LYTYNVETGEVREVTTDSSREGGPDVGFTQRATLDLEQQEIFVLSGLMREKDVLLKSNPSGGSGSGSGSSSSSSAGNSNSNQSLLEGAGAQQSADTMNNSTQTLTSYL